MPLELGEDAFGDGRPVTYEAGEALSPGDVVAIASGQAVTADTNTGGNPNAVGVVADGDGASAAGETVAVHVNGSGIVTNVAAGVTAGTELGPSATEGQLAAASGGFQALSDEGASSGLGSTPVPAGGAVVKLP